MKLPWTLRSDILKVESQGVRERKRMVFEFIALGICLSRCLRNSLVAFGDVWRWMFVRFRTL